MKIEAVRIVKFDAGHRVVNHESKCRTLHGHEYKAEIYCQADLGQLDSLGRVVDFSVIKSEVGGWIDEYLDHNMILFDEDPNLVFIEQCEGLKRPFVIPCNPTAENLAALILEKANSLLEQYHIEVTKIRLWETSNCYVEVSNV